MTVNVWPRNQYTGVGGGAYTGVGGGMYTGVGGGAYTGVGGGLYTGVGGGMYTGAGDSYMSNIPPWPHFVRELEARGYQSQADMIRRYLPERLWPENYFQK